MRAGFRARGYPAIAAGKIAISILSAFAIVYFRLKQVVFRMIFITLLPPVAVILVMQRWFVKGLIEAEK